MFNSAVIYEGKSPYDGAEIMVLASGIKVPSTNVKTGWMIQIYILRKDIREFKNNFLYYLFYRLVRNFLNKYIEVKIYNFKILASNKKNISSHHHQPICFPNSVFCM